MGGTPSKTIKYILHAHPDSKGMRSKMLRSGLPGAKTEISGPNFLVNFRTFCRFHKAQDTEYAHFSVLTNLSQADQYCSHKNVTKAMLHIKQ